MYIRTSIYNYVSYIYLIFFFLNIYFVRMNLDRILSKANLGLATSQCWIVLVRAVTIFTLTGERNLSEIIQNARSKLLTQLQFIGLSIAAKWVTYSRLLQGEIRAQCDIIKMHCNC